MKIRVLLLAVVCVPVLLLAADPWKDKKPSDWSSKDATRVLTNSPWAKTTSASMKFSGMGGGPGGGWGGPGGGSGGPGGGVGGPPGGGVGGPGGGMGGPGGGRMGGPPGGGMGGPEGGMEAPKFVVRWESAAPVREAAARIEDAHGSTISELAKDYYVISTSGSSMMSRSRRAPEGQGRPQPDFSEMQDRLIQVTTLNIKGQDAIAPEKVEVIETAGGMSTLFLFPRSHEISADSNEVTFETTMGPMGIKAKFSLKKMMYDGRLAL